MTQPRLYISPVAHRPQVNITHPGTIGEPDVGMGSPILRIPEFVCCGDKRRPPGYTSWEVIEPETELRYHWSAPAELKQRFATDFWGHVKVVEDEMHFEVTDRNIGDEPAQGGVSLFCLQAGPVHEFQDYDGVNTCVWQNGRFVSVNEMIGGQFKDHRMAGAKVVAGEPSAQTTTRKLMVKRSPQTGFVLAIALDRCASVSGNFNHWPSCIHANPQWDVLEPGEQATVRGKVYLFEGTLDDVLERYIRDFETDHETDT